MLSCDVVVVGGGCVGTSVAYHLAEAGCSDVILLEGNTLASGSTGKAAGGIRTQHGDVLNTRLALRSLTEFTRFEELTGTDIGLRQVGYLFLLDSDADVELFRAAARMQCREGAPVEVLTAAQALDHVPQLSAEGLVGATFCGLDGYATPESVVQGYAGAARRRGVTIRQGTRADRILTDHGRVTGVQLRDEHISTPVVVCAAGIGSASIARTADVELPVTAQRRRIFFSPENGGVRDDVPLTIDFSTGFYFHREGPGLVFAGREFEAEDLLTPAMHRLPLIGDLPIATSWFGDYEVSPDHNGMVGASNAVDGFYYATGFSGHGFQLSPAVGEHLAELITRQAPTLELSELTAERFAPSGTKRHEPIVI